MYRIERAFVGINAQFGRYIEQRVAARVSVSFKSSICIIMFMYVNVSSSGVNMVVALMLSSMVFELYRVVQWQLFTCLASNSLRYFSSSVSLMIRAVFHFGCSICLSKRLEYMF